MMKALQLTNLRYNLIKDAQIEACGLDGQGFIRIRKNTEIPGA